MRTPPALLVALVVLAAAAPSRAQDYREPRGFAWDPAVVERFATLPVQEDGRVKPLQTQVSFLLLRLNGKRSVAVPDDPRFGAAAGTRLSPVEWALDTLFFPAQATEYPVFQVQTTDVVHALGLPHDDKQKRDRYSFQELLAGEGRLMELFGRYGAIDEKARTPVQGQIVDLAVQYSHFRLFVQTLAFGRFRFPLPDAWLAETFGGRDVASLSELLAKGPVLDARWHELEALPADDPRAAGRQVLERVRMEVVRVAHEARLLALFPPDEGETWMSLAQLVDQTLVAPRPGSDLAPQVEAVAILERLAAAVQDPETFARESEALHARLAGLAAARGEYDRVELEVALQDRDPIFKSLLVYVLGFLLAAVSWTRPRSRWAWRGVSLVVAAATALLVVGIVVRCVLRGRPPVSTLYETVLFVTAVVTLSSLVIEWMTRRRVAISLGALLGSAGMFLAAGYERLDGQDTMPTLVAVLDTNFWLATHVTTVTMGYAAGLLAGALAHVYILGRLFGVRLHDRDAYRGVARMVYGVLCFGLLFATVGTILGGVWANESWGRFWGWDPKENGALMIVLWILVTLHARMGGYVRELGLCLMAVCGNIVVAFSWWGVNLLGVGLHSYGFTAGVQRTLDGFYAVESGVVLLGIVAWAVDARRATAAKASAPPPARITPASDR